MSKSERMNSRKMAPSAMWNEGHWLEGDIDRNGSDSFFLTSTGETYPLVFENFRDLNEHKLLRWYLRSFIGKSQTWQSHSLELVKEILKESEGPMQLAGIRGALEGLHVETEDLAYKWPEIKAALASDPNVLKTMNPDTWEIKNPNQRTPRVRMEENVPVGLRENPASENEQPQVTRIEFFKLIMKETLKPGDIIQALEWLKSLKQPLQQTDDEKVHLQRLVESGICSTNVPEALAIEVALARPLLVNEGLDWASLVPKSRRKKIASALLDLLSPDSYLKIVKFAKDLNLLDSVFRLAVLDRLAENIPSEQVKKYIRERYEAIRDDPKIAIQNPKTINSLVRLLAQVENAGYELAELMKKISWQKTEGDDFPTLIDCLNLEDWSSLSLLAWSDFFRLNKDFRDQVNREPESLERVMNLLDSRMETEKLPDAIAGLLLLPKQMQLDLTSQGRTLISRVEQNNPYLADLFTDKELDLELEDFRKNIPELLKEIKRLEGETIDLREQLDLANQRVKELNETARNQEKSDNQAEVARQISLDADILRRFEGPTKVAFEQLLGLESSQAREAMERIALRLKANGLELLGFPGEIVDFNPEIHVLQGEVTNGSVRIVEIGLRATIRGEEVVLFSSKVVPN